MSTTDATPLLQSMQAIPPPRTTVDVPPPRRSSLRRRINPLLGIRNVDLEDRELYSGPQKGMDTSFYPHNRVDNRRYSALSFVFLSLGRQFFRSWTDWNYFNIYYLGLSISQFFSIFQVGFWFTYLGPLVFVVFLSMLKELYDDIKRWTQDRRINSATYKRIVVGRNGSIASDTISLADAQHMSVRSGGATAGTVTAATFLDDGRSGAAAADTAASAMPSRTHRSGSLAVSVDRDGSMAGSDTGLPLFRSRSASSFSAPVFPMEEVDIASADIQVGMLLHVKANQRIPADLVLLQTSEVTGTCFVRTDQLDGETDWKLRFPAKCTGKKSHAEIASTPMLMYAEKPSTAIDKFTGTLTLDGQDTEGLGARNMLWCGCTVTAGSVIGLVVYTGTDTRIAMNQQQPKPKSGLVDSELNRVSLMCFGLLLVMSFGLVLQQYVQIAFSASAFVIYLMRFQILLSTIVPISMRINIDVARFWYTLAINKDSKLQGIQVRNTDIPEELGRIRFLFSDKTGTLTRNVMEFRELHVAEDLCVEHSSTEEIAHALSLFIPMLSAQVSAAGGGAHAGSLFSPASGSGGMRQRASSATRLSAAPMASPATRSNDAVLGFGNKQAGIIGNAMLMLALCNNVTPVTDADTGVVSFQAASPDEIAMVEFAASVGIRLAKRTLEGTTEDSEGEIELHTNFSEASVLTYDILKTFPFSSERKSMGIILREKWGQRRTWFYMKGADTRMNEVLAQNEEWLRERCDQMAAKGRRTLVFGFRELKQEELELFLKRLKTAEASKVAREQNVETVMRDLLERNLRIGCATGVEDRLQENVIETLERLRSSGVRIWMLTGDKVETARCIAMSTKLVAPDCPIESLVCQSIDELRDILFKLKGESPQGRMSSEADLAVGFLDTNGTPSSALIIDGKSLEYCLKHPDLREAFVEVATRAPAVVVARCSPTQKAEVVKLVIEYSDRMNEDGSSSPTPSQQASTTDVGSCKHAPMDVGGDRGLYADVTTDNGMLKKPNNAPRPSFAQRVTRFCQAPTKLVVRTAAIGDGGNDVSMILSAHVGIGVEGKEGKQASLAADFSIVRFCDVDRLLTWHGRNAYQSTCQLAQLVLHRGIIFAVVQAVFSMMFRGCTMPVFNSFMILMYPTFLTAAPIFGIVLNEDCREQDVDLFPEHYKRLFKSRSLNTRSFLSWVWVSFFQGGVMMIISLRFFGNEFFRVVTIAFTALLATEYIVVAWSLNYRILWVQGKQGKIGIFFVSILLSLACYAAMVFFFPNTIDRDYVMTSEFWILLLLVTAISVIPPAVIWALGRCLTERLSKPRLGYAR